MKAVSIDSIAEKSAGKTLSVIRPENIHTEQFYQTGFEELYFNEGRSVLSEAVISSVIPMDGELLIVGNSEICDMWRHVCHELSINVCVIDGQDTEACLEDALNAILSVNRRVTHIICSADRTSASLELIGKKAREYRRSLIVDNSTYSISFDTVNMFNIDFVITSASEEISLILARRSKLVQTEGNARQANHDIYAIWQDNMRQRRPTLEPMAC